MHQMVAWVKDGGILILGMNVENNFCGVDSEGVSFD
jgi:hypothetical protein